MRCLSIIVFLLAAACSDSTETLNIDGPPATCVPSGSCSEGPACGAGCCGVGERCVNNVCRCGGGVACTAGNTCQPPGPVGPDQCGTICCGSGPCPQ